MAKSKILLQLDSDPQPSVFDSVVAVDAGVEHLLRHGGVTPENVRELVYGCIFTRGGDDLASTAIFIGGSNVAAGEALLAPVRKTFFGPMRVSVMLDSNGANTTAVAAVLAAAKERPLAGAHVTVLAATGPVGSRVARLLAGQGALVRVASRSAERAEATAEAILAQVSGAELTACAVSDSESAVLAIADAEIVIAAGAPGVELLPLDARKAATNLRVAIDLSAVPPAGIAGVQATDRAEKREGIVYYGALGVGGLKMKIHKAALRRLFESHDQVLDAEQIFDLGRSISG